MRHLVVLAVTPEKQPDNLGRRRHRHCEKFYHLLKPLPIPRSPCGRCLFSENRVAEGRGEEEEKRICRVQNVNPLSPRYDRMYSRGLRRMTSSDTRHHVREADLLTKSPESCRWKKHV